MCLFTEEREPRIADRDITCYKIVSVRGGKYYTPYVKRRIQKRYIIGRDLYCAHGELNIKNCSNAFYVAHRFANNNQFFAIGKGFIHTCGGTAEEAFKHVGSDQQLFECIIPKGTEYYVGYEGYVLASKVIRFVRHIVPRFVPYE